MRKLRGEMHRRLLGNGYCARPVSSTATSSRSASPAPSSLPRSSSGPPCKPNATTPPARARWHGRRSSTDYLTASIRPPLDTDHPHKPQRGAGSRSPSRALRILRRSWTTSDCSALVWPFMSLWCWRSRPGLSSSQRTVRSLDRFAAAHDRRGGDERLAHLADCPVGASASGSGPERRAKSGARASRRSGRPRPLGPSQCPGPLPSS